MAGKMTPSAPNRRVPLLAEGILLAGATILAVCAGAVCETVELVDGQQVKGKVTQNTTATVVIQLSPTQTFSLPKQLVQRIWRDDETPPPPFKGDGKGIPSQIQAYPRMPDPKDAYPTISVQREAQVAALTDELLKLPTPQARAARLASLPKADANLMPHATTVERWLDPNRRFPQAAGKAVLIDLPWKGANERAVAYVGVPADYDPLKRAWPLVIALHGTEDAPLAIATHFKGVVSEGNCILFAPRTTDGRDFWTSPAQWANIRAGIGLLADHYRIDPRRIAICGGSGGGMGTWGLATRYPELFRAAGSFSGMPGVSPSAMGRLKNVPFYILHGRSDHIPIAGPREMVAAMRKAGIEPTYVEYDGNHFPPRDEIRKIRLWIQSAPPKADLSPRPAVLRFILESQQAKPLPAPPPPPTTQPATRPATRRSPPAEANSVVNTPRPDRIADIADGGRRRGAIRKMPDR